MLSLRQRRGDLMSRTRTIKKQDRSLKSILITYGIGSLLVIYIGCLLGASYLPNSSLSDFLNNFNQFVIKEHHFIVGFNRYTAIFSVSFWIAFSLAFIIIMTKIRHPFAGQEYGSAKWGDAKSFSEEFANHEDKNIITVNTGDVRLSHPLKVNTANYWLAEDVYLSINNEKTSNLNMLIVGPPGSGKTFRCCKPLLSNLCGNFVVTDPKGELYKQTGQYFEDNGYEVMVMNVESEDMMPMSIRFNPFKYIRNESDIMSIAGILMKSTTPSEDNNSTDQFFEQSAEVLLISIIYLMHYYEPIENRTWKRFVELLESTCVYTSSDGSIDNREGGILSIMEDANKMWKDSGHDGEFPGFKNVEKFYNGAAETTSSIVASLDAHCRYMKLKCVIDLLSEDEIKITESFGYSKPCKSSSTGKRILYIVTSEDKTYYDWIPSMIYSLFFDELYHLTTADVDLHETLPQHLTFLMDEFANVTLPDSFVEKLSTMRSRNMSAAIIIQNLIQLKRKFPKYDMDKDLIGNCAIIDILGAPDMDSCEYLSKHFGTMTIHKASDSDSKDYKGSSTRNEDVLSKPLLSAEDIFAMKKDGECAIVVKGTDPLYQTKCQVEKTDFVRLLCRKANPYDPTKRIKKRQERDSEPKELILCGDKARDFVKRYKDNGGSVIRLDMDDIKIFDMALESYQEVSEFPITDHRKKVLKDNYVCYKDKMIKTFDFDLLLTKEEKKANKSPDENMVFVAQGLINQGFYPKQIEIMIPLIRIGYSLDKLLKLFNKDSSIEEINSLIKVLS